MRADQAGFRRLRARLGSYFVRTNFTLQTGESLADKPSRSRSALRPSFALNFPPSPIRGSRECRVRAAPAVSCASLHKECAHEHTGSAEAIRHSLRNGFTAYGALSPATNSSCHRHRRIGDFARPGWARENLRRLDTSNGCQDHTLLPYAATRLRRKRLCRALAPFVLREGYRSRDKPALRFRPCTDAAASTASRPNVRDDGQRPSWGQDGAGYRFDLGLRRRGIFL